MSSDKSFEEARADAAAREPQRPTAQEVAEALRRRDNEREAAVQTLRDRLESFDADTSAEVTRSSRGLEHLDSIPSTYGGEIKIYESSLAEHPHIWVDIAQPVDLNDPKSGVLVEAVAHLPIEGAALLAKQLTYLADNHYQTG